MRLINADEIQYTKDWVVTDKIPKVGGYNAKAIYRVTKEEIDAMPTVEAVPVVRCKDCKHNPKIEWFGCPMASLSEKQRPETAWCWKGERKDDDNG